MPWLIVNLGTAVLAGFVITLFQDTMGQVVALAAFLPVIAGQGGIAGTQTLTLIIRSITLGEVSPANSRQLLLKELGLGLVHGFALGLVVGVIAFFWKGSEYLALVVGVAMVANLVVAGISGVVVPLGFRALKIDPALSSAVAVTTVTDVLGFPGVPGACDCDDRAHCSEPVRRRRLLYGGVTPDCSQLWLCVIYFGA